VRRKTPAPNSSQPLTAHSLVPSLPLPCLNSKPLHLQLYICICICICIYIYICIHMYDIYVYIIRYLYIYMFLCLVLQCFSIVCLITVEWMCLGYSLAFSEGNAVYGGPRYCVANVLLMCR